MIRRLIASGLLVAAAAFATTGCVVEVSFDPFGSDFSVTGNWTIEGNTPTVDNCAAIGIDRVRVVFYDNDSPYFYDDLVWPCSQGSFTTDQIFRYGDYETEWQALSSSGVIVGRSDMRTPLVVRAPLTGARLQPVDFGPGGGGFDPRGTDFPLSADWTVNGVAADATSCAAAGIATVSVVLYDVTDTGYTDGYPIGSAACSTGKWDSPGAVIRNGRYLTSVQGFDAGGTLVDSYESPNELNTTMATMGTLVRLMTAPLVGTAVTSLTVTLQWDTDPSSAVMTPGTCASAGVDVMSYMLTDTATSMNYSQDFDVACGDTLFWEDIPAGAYSLYAEGGTMAVKTWMVTCTGINVVDGAANTATCLVTDVSGG